jgi:hypothetical protein
MSSIAHSGDGSGWSAALHIVRSKAEFSSRPPQPLTLAIEATPPVAIFVAEGTLAALRN